MDDDFLNEFRRDPRPEFARSLHERLDTPMKTSRLAPARVWKPAAAGLATAATLLVLFSFPAARAAAGDFLDMFRVRRFAAVPFDPERLARLKEDGLDVKALLGDDVETLKKAHKPRLVQDLGEASEVAGLEAPVAPAFVPAGAGEPEIRVTGESSTRVTANAAKLRAILDALEVNDVEVSSALDGASVRVDVPSAIVMRYKRGGEHVTFVQARSPEISLPEGVDLARLGEIGLRITGMSAAEASSFARSVDWHSTLLVPIPADAASFREVDVNGQPALLVTSSGKLAAEKNPDGVGERQRNTLLWSDGAKVYAVMGGASTADLLDMARSVR